MLCYISADNTSHKVDADLTPEQSYTITCTYNDVEAAIPKFIQFSCEGSARITVDINITNGTQQQKITKEIQVAPNRKLYEVPVLAYVSNEIIQNGHAKVNSIVFSNNMKTVVQLEELRFSNMTSNYEVRLNQVFTVDLSGALTKNYYIKTSSFKDVSINLYKANGEFTQKISKSLANGDNYLNFDETPLQQGKYVVVITENDTKKSPGSNITVMN
ncbi:MAG: hypothetical protein U0X41_11995 [Chitinophagales bacterium]